VKTYKAFVKLNGEVGSKEIPGIEYIDKNYYEKLQKQQKELKELLSKRNINESAKNRRNELTDNKLNNR
jgi:methionyl-tRNA synthetase